MKLNRRPGAPILVWVALLAGCATAPSSNPFAAPGEQQGRDIRILVRNQALEVVRIYALPGGQNAQELGEVSSMSTAQMRMPWPRTGNVRFRVEPLAALRHTTNTILVQPGDIVDLYIPSDPSNAYARVR